MYTKEKLESESFLRLYKHVGKNSLKKMVRAEGILSKREKSDLDIHFGKETFSSHDDTMHYTSSANLNRDGSYLKTSVIKKKEENKVDITLELGTEGYDLATGERYDRTQARVRYTYGNNNISIKEIEDEWYFNIIEDKKSKQIIRKVLLQKK